MTVLSFEEAIDQIGFGRFQQKLLFICGLGWAADAMEVLLISFALPAIRQEWNLTSAQTGLLGTAIFLGMLVGAWFWGRLSDGIGRKVSFIATVLIASLFGLFSALAPSFVWLLVLRGLTGFGVGGMLPVDYSIFAEYLPAHRRGRYLVLLESFWALGSLLAAGLAWAVVPTLGWRWLFAIPAISAAIVLFIRLYIPESPRFLLVKGKVDQSARILRQVALENGRELADFHLKPLISTKSSVGDIWKPVLRRTTFLLWAIWFLISLGYYGVFTWLPNSFKSQGMGLLPVYQNSFILALAQLPGYFSAAYLVERLGRRKTLGFYLIASGLFTFLFAAVTSLNWIVAMGIWMSFFTLGAWGALYAYTPEAYPTILRGTGMGAASGMTRIAGAIAPSLGGILLNYSLLVPLTVFALSYVLAGTAAFFLPGETSQKPLADS
ncbi:MAG: MFS transporter [Anaerolineaceae bacterium]|nr:MFS transporter [Anaerolineaceae bacterium]